MTRIIEVQKPFKGEFPMTQPFGVYFYYKKRRLKHQGTDWGMPVGTPMLSSFNGTVSRVEKYRLDGYGPSIYIQSSDGKFETLHAHLNGIYVEKGQKVEAGEKIGSSGDKGFSTGPHLHYGLKVFGEYVNAEKYIDVGISEKDRLIKTDEYKVKRGDTLFEIASMFYVGGDLWPLLHKENEKLIGSDPNKIYPGQILRIPKANKLKL